LAPVSGNGHASGINGNHMGSHDIPREQVVLVRSAKGLQPLG